MLFEATHLEEACPMTQGLGTSDILEKTQAKLPQKGAQRLVSPHADSCVQWHMTYTIRTTSTVTLQLLVDNSATCQTVYSSSPCWQPVRGVTHMVGSSVTA